MPALTRLPILLTPSVLLPLALIAGCSSGSGSSGQNGLIDANTGGDGRNTIDAAPRIDATPLTPCQQAAADRSSVGCVYYAVDTNPLHATIPGDYAIAMSNIDTVSTANVVVEVNNGGTWTVVSGGALSVSPLSLVTLPLPHRFVSGSALSPGGAYRITADLPIVAYQFNPLDGSASFLSDASLLLPRASFDKFYLLPAWPFGPADSAATGYPAHVQIVASQATRVTVTSPAQTIAGGVGVPAIAPGGTQVFTLAGEGDFLQLTVQTPGQSFNGLHIEADKPVAVFSSNDCANVPASASACCCEHLEEQIVGLQTWGKEYVASRVPVRRAGSPEPAIWQIMAQEADTIIQFQKNPQVSGLPAAVTLNAREMIQYTVGGTIANPGDFLVRANKPILVTQYMVGATVVQAGGTNGDPSMVQAVASEQYLDKYVVLVPNTWINDVLVLTRKTGETVSIDGVAVTAGWTPVGTSSFEVSRVPAADGVHVLLGSKPFGVLVVGYDSYDSYAYPGGLSQQVINVID